MDDLVKLAGISVTSTGKVGFHASEKSEERIGVQLSPLHSTTFDWVALPRKMNRIKAAEFIRDHKKFRKIPEVKTYLDGWIERSKARQDRENAPRRPVGRPRMRRGRPVEAAGRRKAA